MHTIKDHTEDVYFMACDPVDPDNCHFGVVKVGQEMGTGQADLQTFETEEELKTAVDMMNFDGYYESKTNI